MIDIPADLLPRLAKLLELAGSSHDGERATAALKAHELVRSHGLTLTDIIMRPRIGVRVAEIRKRPMYRNDEIPQIAAGLLQHEASLADWETTFLQSMVTRTSFTEGQQRKVHEIRERVLDRQAREERQRCSP